MRGKDLLGMKFSRLLVIEKLNEKRYQKTQWKCLCDCGKEVVVVGSELSSGSQKSCGCLRHRVPKSFKDITGNKYGRLTVLARAPNKYKRRTSWFCKCDCGTEGIFPGQSMKAGLIKSCGCIVDELRKRTGENSPNYKKGYYINGDGYVLIRNESLGRKSKSRAQHIVIMEKFLKRMLRPKETVHHKNGIKADNRLDNLELWSSRHPKGQRVSDMIDFCVDYLSEYAPEYLSIIKKVASDG